MNPNIAEVWLADLGLAAKVRPVVIMSYDDPDAPRALTIYIPLTRQNRGSAYEITLGHIAWLANESVANVQGIGSLPRSRFEKRLGVLPKADFLKIQHALIYACKLPCEVET
jgi:mRNA interferase MazF